MSEADAIRRAAERGPATVTSLAADLRSLGVEPGQTLIFHSSLSRLGFVIGGARTVVDALTETIGDAGTLVMPTHTPNLTEPSHWEVDPIPEAWWQAFRDEVPPFDPAKTPTWRMGRVPELFRTMPGVIRSNHPVASFAARGPHAATITADQPLPAMFGEASPIARLYELGASALLLGVGHGNNTSLHLAEHRAAELTGKPLPMKPGGVAMLVDGRREWVRHDREDYDCDPFEELGAAYAAAGGTVRTGRIGSGDATLVPVREVIDFGTRWLADRPPAA